MPYRCILDLAVHWQQARALPALELSPEICPPGMPGDITLNCFRLAKDWRANPMALAQEAAAFLGTHPDVAAVSVIKGFTNIELQAPALFRDTVADAGALLAAPQLSPERCAHYLIEYSSPNTNKPQHLGHVRNNTFGQALCSILARAGHRVTAVNLVNDRGIHICKSMIAYQRWGQGVTPETAGKKGDHLVGDFYVKYDLALKEQLKALRAQNPAEDRTDEQLFLATELGQAAQEMLRQWEAGDAAVHALWRQLNAWVLAGFNQTYGKMGIAFDKTYYESDTYLLGREIVQEGLQKGVFARRGDGATEIDLADRKLGKKVVLRADGTTVYVTQDLGTTLRKREDFQPEHMIWITADEQLFHFQVLFAILEKLGYEWAKGLHHLSYGMVNLPTGRMKSREGTVVDADDLFAEMEQLAREETLARVGDQVPADLDQRAAVLALGALKFMLLKVSPKTTMTFDPNASIKFEGDTGPYLQYAYARIASIQRKQREQQVEVAAQVDWSLLGQPEERQLAVLCAGYGDVVQRAAQNMDPSLLASYLLEVAKAFSRFYKQHSVLQAETPALRRVRLELCARVQALLGDGLHTLTIGTLESM